MWKKEGLICQTSEAPERRFLPQAHALVEEEGFFLLLSNFLSAGQVLLNIKVSTIGGNYTVSCLIDSNCSFAFQYWNCGAFPPTSRTQLFIS